MGAGQNARQMIAGSDFQPSQSMGQGYQASLDPYREGRATATVGTGSHARPSPNRSGTHGANLTSGGQ